jgi:hypothetical protein
VNGISPSLKRKTKWKITIIANAQKTRHNNGGLTGFKFPLDWAELLRTPPPGHAIRNSQEALEIRYALGVSHVVTGNCPSFPSRWSQSPPKLVRRTRRAHFHSYHPVSPRASNMIMMHDGTLTIAVWCGCVRGRQARSPRQLARRTAMCGRRSRAWEKDTSRTGKWRSMVTWKR